MKIGSSAFSSVSLLALVVALSGCASEVAESSSNEETEGEEENVGTVQQKLSLTGANAVDAWVYAGQPYYNYDRMIGQGGWDPTITKNSGYRFAQACVQYLSGGQWINAGCSWTDNIYNPTPGGMDTWAVAYVTSSSYQVCWRTFTYYYTSVYNANRMVASPHTCNYKKPR